MAPPGDAARDEDAGPPAADPLRALLAAGAPVVIDGGLATELEAAGHDLADRLWSARLLADEPEAIVEAHLAYFRAGARVTITASYQATFEGFAARGLGRAASAGLLRRSVELAAEARARYRVEVAPIDPDPLLVAASIGPHGAYLADGSEYRGDGRLGRAALRDWHRPRLEALWAAAPDLLACETIPGLLEAEALAGLLAETGAVGWLALTCADAGHLRDGSPVEAAADLADATPAIAAVGVNCTPPEHVAGLVARIRSRTTKPIVVYPNSGEGWDAVARRWLPATGPTVDAPTARTWVAAGATLVGGCCRVGPATIEALARDLATGPA